MLTLVRAFARNVNRQSDSAFPPAFRSARSASRQNATSDAFVVRSVEVRISRHL